MKNSRYHIFNTSRKKRLCDLKLPNNFYFQNCLHLKYHDIKVSLQQAYSLLLRDKITIMHYNVYASLSRLGYRVYRHEQTEGNIEEKHNVTPCIENVDDATNKNDTDNKIKEKSKSLENASNDIENSNCSQNTQSIEQNIEYRDNTTGKLLLY